MRVPFVSSILAMTLMLFASDAEAASPGLCDAFVAAVIKRAAQNQDNQCGFSDARNYNDPVAQRRWCLTTSEEDVVSESVRRDKETQRCVDCRDYTTQANVASIENRRLHCGYTGDRWGSGEGHMTWCMAQPERWSGGIFGAIGQFYDGYASDDEQGYRTTALNQCKAKYTPAQLDKCTEYAIKGVAQAKFNHEHQCGGEGGRWSEDFDSHFAYCTWGWLHNAEIALDMKSETDIREAENKLCEYRIALGRKIRYGSRGSGNSLAPPASGNSANQGDAGKNKAAAGRDAAASRLSTVKSDAVTTSASKLRKRNISTNPVKPVGSSGFNTARSDKHGVSEDAFSRLGAAGTGSALDRAAGMSSGGATGVTARPPGFDRSGPANQVVPTGSGGFNTSRSDASTLGASSVARPSFSGGDGGLMRMAPGTGISPLR